MTTGMTYQLLHSPLTARNSCIVSFQWLFTVLKDKKWCSTHSKFIAFTSSGLTGSIVVRQPSRRRCPEEWLHLNLCYSRDLRSVPRHWYDQYDKGGARRGGKVLLPDDGDINSLIGNTTHSRWWPPPSWWKKDNCFDSPGRGPLRIFKDLSDYTVPRLRLAIIMQSAEEEISERDCLMERKTTEENPWWNTAVFSDTNGYLQALLPTAIGW